MKWKWNYVVYFFWGFDSLSLWRHVHMHMVALWHSSSSQFHLRWPLDPPILPAVIFTGLFSSSTPSGQVHYWYQHFWSAALCYSNITRYLPPPPPHPLWCSPGHSPWWPRYISPIPSVAGTLASHLLCLLLSGAPLLSLPLTLVALLSPPLVALPLLLLFPSNDIKCYFCFCVLSVFASFFYLSSSHRGLILS